ncbi:MAG: hypothetical protein IKB02_04840 [Clostridia bacterium]|nr:hypothetical protein [Clostridia bacterium]
MKYKILVFLAYLFFMLFATRAAAHIVDTAASGEEADDRMLQLVGFKK